MIAFREEFIKKYIEKLNHKVEQILKDKLPETGFFAEMVETADIELIKVLQHK